MRSGYPEAFIFKTDNSVFDLSRTMMEHFTILLPRRKDGEEDKKSKEGRDKI
jgi:hypothetical protein